jgi:hypothetical protein
MCRYPLLLVTTYGVGDLVGKLLPLWRPGRPQATVLGLAVARLGGFLALFSAALALQAGPAVFFPAVFILSLTGWCVNMSGNASTLWHLGLQLSSSM